jgi:hypothetical protein
MTTPPQTTAENPTTDFLLKLFQGHGVECAVENGWVVPNWELPALRAHWYPLPSRRLDVQVLIEDKLVIEECFAGVGEGDAARYDALASFTINSFHVLLAALWGKNDPDQVTTEEWMVGGKRYTAYLGNFGTRGSEGVTACIPPDLFAAIKAAIRREPLIGDIHWFRLFVGNVAHALTFEALRDNEVWDEGVRCLRGRTWEPSPGYYSVRLFAVLRAADEALQEKWMQEKAPGVSRWGKRVFGGLRRFLKS